MLQVWHRRTHSHVHPPSRSASARPVLHPLRLHPSEGGAGEAHLHAERSSLFVRGAVLEAARASDCQEQQLQSGLPSLPDGDHSECGSHFRGIFCRASIAGFGEEFELHESLAVVVGVESRFSLDGAGHAVVFSVFSPQSKFVHAGRRAPTERSALCSRPVSRFIHGERVWITRLLSSSSAVTLPT